MRSIVPILSVLMAACGGPPEPPATPSPTTTLADLAWIDGMWRSAIRDERWLHVAGALYGVALDDTGYAVYLIDDQDDDGRPVPITLTTYTVERDPEDFKLVRANARRVEFADGPRVARFARTATGLSDGAGEVAFALDANVMAPAPEVEAADREFAIATAKDGADAWAHYFRPDGWIWRGARITGPDAVRAAMMKTLTGNVLAWRPVASGQHGEWGFTLGTYEYSSARRGPAQAHGSYCTIWGMSADGWRVLFDVGHPAGDD